MHPGYGFLSENAEFAEACADAGLVFIGPPAAAIRAMGSKAAAKALMAGARRAGRARLSRRRPGPGAAARRGRADRLSGADQGVGRRRRARHARRRAAPASSPRALDGAKREAEGAFGDDRVLIERYLERPRHIEIQVFADTHGNIVHLFERDCSIQRRHQKVLEEAPAPGLDPASAQGAGRGGGRGGARGRLCRRRHGRVHRRSRRRAFYFMEMNTRLQVEHPVTEAMTGLDLVEWQLRVAAGETLPLAQDEIALRGHAIEARLYAEDPERGFLPATGTLHGLRLPEPDDCAGRYRGARGRHGDAVLRSDDRQDHRLGRGPRGRARRLAARARRDRGARRHDQSRVSRARRRRPGIRRRRGRYRLYRAPSRHAAAAAARRRPMLALAAAALYRLLRARAATRDAGGDRFALGAARWLAAQPRAGAAACIFRYGADGADGRAVASRDAAGICSLAIAQCLASGRARRRTARSPLTLDGVRTHRARAGARRCARGVRRWRKLAVRPRSIRWRRRQAPISPPAG